MVWSQRYRYYRVSFSLSFLPLFHKPKALLLLFFFISIQSSPIPFSCSIFSCFVLTLLSSPLSLYVIALKQPNTCSSSAESSWTRRTLGFERARMCASKPVRLWRGCHRISRGWETARKWFFRSNSEKRRATTTHEDSGKRRQSYPEHGTMTMVIVRS